MLTEAVYPWTAQNSHALLRTWIQEIAPSSTLTCLILKPSNETIIHDGELHRRLNILENRCFVRNWRTRNGFLNSCWLKRFILVQHRIAMDSSGHDSKKLHRRLHWLRWLVRYWNQVMRQSFTMENCIESLNVLENHILNYSDVTLLLNNLKFYIKSKIYRYISCCK